MSRLELNIPALIQQIGGREKISWLPARMELRIEANPSTGTILVTHSGEAIIPITARQIQVKEGEVLHFQAHRHAITSPPLLECHAYGVRSVEGNPVPILVVEFVDPSAHMPPDRLFSGVLETRQQFNFIPPPYPHRSNWVPIGYAAQEWQDSFRQLGPSILEVYLAVNP